MDLELTGKNVLISGGATGIGQACALAFAREGARLAILDWNAAALAQTEAQLKELGAEVLGLTVDVSNGQQVEDAHRQVIDTFGGIDIGFNNAGIIGPAKRIQDMSEDEWDSVVNVNLKGMWLCVRAQIRHMVSAGHGVIVNTASAAALVGAPGTTPYTSAKHGILGLTRTVALEVADQNIRVNAVAPGTVETSLNGSLNPTGDDPFANALVRQGHPNGRNARPDEIADAVLWLASARSSFATGSTLVVDGGFTAQ